MNADVVVVGLGPAAQMLVALLGAHGHRIAVLEKFQSSYGLPRTSTLDGEVARLLQHRKVAARWTLASRRRAPMTVQKVTGDEQ